MFVRAKKSGAYQYLQLVRSERLDGHVQGRLDSHTNWIRFWGAGHNR